LTTVLENAVGCASVIWLCDVMCTSIHAGVWRYIDLGVWRRGGRRDGSIEPHEKYDSNVIDKSTFLHVIVSEIFKDALYN